jgi:chemotaxis methyl-accepting protein methylase
MSLQELTADPAYEALRDLLLREYGVDIRAANATVFQNKLEAYLQRHQLGSVGECIDYITADDARMRQLSDFIYSQSTHFNRQPQDFEFVVGRVLEERQHERATADDPLTFWSLGCSSGQEGYTLAIHLMQRVFTTPESARNFRVIGSDCSQPSLETARRGVYPVADVQKLDPGLVDAYFEDAGEGELRVAPRVRERVEFNEFNFTAPHYPYRAAFDYVFLRNALDFHTRPSRAAILGNVHGALKPGGCVIIGEWPLAPADRFQVLQPGYYRAV